MTDGIYIAVYVDCRWRTTRYKGEVTMLLSSSSLLGYKVHASDSLVGEVYDLYFDDKQWEIKYFVVKIGGFWRNRKILIANTLIEKIDTISEMLMVCKTGDEVRHCPSITTDKPVFEQIKEQSIEYYMWAAHWTPYSGEPEPQSKFTAVGDPHLRSVRYLNGNTLQARDGVVGQLDDFLVEDDGWGIPQMIVEVTSRLKEQFMILPTSLITDFHCEEKMIDIDSEKRDIRSASIYQPETCDMSIPTYI